MLSRRFHRWADQYVVRDPEKNRPVILNNWEATHCKFDESRLVKLFDGARDVGAELFLLDDGWFGNDRCARNDDRHGLGDWQVDGPNFLAACLISPVRHSGVTSDLAFGLSRKW